MGETRWKPDTCSCVLVIEGDTSLIRREAACERHRGLSPNENYAAVLEENRRKNTILNDLTISLPDLAPHEVLFTVDDKGIEFSIPESYMTTLAASGKSGFAAGYKNFALTTYRSH